MVMFDTGIDLTVVVPTYNREARLGRLLTCLDRQITSTGASRPGFTFEVVVVSDGSTDGTHALVDGFTGKYPLRLLVQDNAGPASARNAGILAAEGEVVMFLDDDVMPEPHCLEAHMSRHLAEPATVVVGPMLTPTDVELQPWIRWEQYQLEKQYARFESGEVLHPRQFYTGNASVRRQALLDAGLFDTTLLRSEDIELAGRLELVGQSFTFAPNATAYHYAERSFESWAKVAYDYGKNDVLFANNQQQQDLQHIPRFFDERNPLQRALVRALVPRPSLRAAGQQILERAASLGNTLGAKDLNRQLLSGLYGLHYYQGVADGLGSAEAFMALIDGTSHAHGDDQDGQPFIPWLVLEQTLGHITHGKNLRSLVPKLPRVEPVFVPVDFDFSGMAARVPGWSNWTIRAGVRANRNLARMVRDRGVPGPSAILVHSQVPAILLGAWMKRVPTVVSLDATPKQYDALGEFYNHQTSTGRSEQVKDWMNQRCYDRAKALVTWSSWAKDGLVDEYGVDPDKITVIAPGVDVDKWERPGHIPRPAGVLRILFVGGDLARKGGDELLAAQRILRTDPAVPDFELHLVTGTAVPAEKGVFVHTGLTSNAPELIAQYHLADIFCLPTHGDCLPMVLAEAGAAGLPLVSTDVAAISGIVKDGETGLLVRPGDVDGLVVALRELLVDSDRRLAFGAAARALVEREHNAADNAAALIEVMRKAARTS